MQYINSFLTESKYIIDNIDVKALEKTVNLLVNVRNAGGRLFILGVGGGAGHASHAVNDFRKIANFEAYSPSDNVSELTARINDDGWDTCYQHWLQGSRLNKKDAVLVFSVGGGNFEKQISVNIVNALRYAKTTGSTILGIVGCHGGYTDQVADACIKIPSLHKETVTPQTEAFQAVFWHLIVSHPKIQKNEMKWESVSIKRENNYSASSA